MQEKDEFEESRRHLALEVLVTLSETSSAMVRKLAKKYMPRLGETLFCSLPLDLLVAVPQLLEMMVDLDDDADWAMKDTIEDEEDDRWTIQSRDSLRALFFALAMQWWEKVP